MPASIKATVDAVNRNGDLHTAIAWLDGDLPPSYEKEGRAATCRVLECFAELLADTSRSASYYLHRLAKASDPDSVPEAERRFYTRIIHFGNNGPRAKATRVAIQKHLEIAMQVQWLRNRHVKGAQKNSNKVRHGEHPSVENFTRPPSQTHGANVDQDRADAAWPVS